MAHLAAGVSDAVPDDLHTRMGRGWPLADFARATDMAGRVDRHISSLL